MVISVRMMAVGDNHGYNRVNTRQLLVVVRTEMTLRMECNRYMQFKLHVVVCGAF